MLPSEARKIVAVLQTAYPQWRPTEETEGLWAEMIGDMDYRTVNLAIRKILSEQEREFPPPIATVCRVAAELESPALLVSPEEAWAEVQQAVRQVGSYRVPTWSHPALAQAVQALGWREICMADQGDSGMRAHFFRTYQAYQHRAREALMLPDELRPELPKPEPDRPRLAEVKAITDERPAKRAGARRF